MTQTDSNTKSMLILFFQNTFFLSLMLSNQGPIPARLQLAKLNDLYSVVIIFDRLLVFDVEHRQHLLYKPHLPLPSIKLTILGLFLYFGLFPITIY